VLRLFLRGRRDDVSPTLPIPSGFPRGLPFGLGGRPRGRRFWRRVVFRGVRGRRRPFADRPLRKATYDKASQLSSPLVCPWGGGDLRGRIRFTVSTKPSISFSNSNALSSKLREGKCEGRRRGGKWPRRKGQTSHSEPSTRPCPASPNIKIVKR